MIFLELDLLGDVPAHGDAVDQPSRLVPDGRDGQLIFLDLAAGGPPGDMPAPDLARPDGPVHGPGDLRAPPVDPQDLLEGPTDDLVGPERVMVPERRIGGQDPAVQVGDGDPVGELFDRRRQPQPGLFGIPERRDVAGRREDAVDLAVGVLVDRRVVEDLRHRARGMADSQGIIADLALLEHLPVAGLGLFGLREVGRKIRADQESPRDAGHGLRGPVHVRDLPFGVDRHERVQAGLDQPPGIGRGRSQRSFDAPPVGDVAADLQDGRRLSPGLPRQHGPTALDDDLLSVLPGSDQLALPMPGFHQAVTDGLQALREPGPQESVGDASQRLPIRPAVDLPGAVVPECDPVSGVADEDRVAGQVEKSGLLAQVHLALMALGDLPPELADRPDQLGRPFGDPLLHHLIGRAEGLLGGLPLADVHELDEVALDGPSRAPERHDLDVERDQAGPPRTRAAGPADLGGIE